MSLRFPLHPPVLSSLLTIIALNSAIVVHSSAAETITSARSQPSSPVQSVSLNVYYEKSTGQITIDASQAPLDKVLEFVAKDAAIKIDVEDEQLLQSRISIEIALQPVEEALKVLLEGFNTMFLYSDRDQPTTETRRPLLAGVKVISKKKEGAISSARGSNETGVVRLGNVPGHRNQQAGRDVSDRYELDRLLQALKETRSESEKRQIIDSLLGRLLDAPEQRDHQAFSDILSQLKEHAPERAVEPLVGLLYQPEQNRVFRSMAARTLGEIGGEHAVDPLIWAFNDPDPLVQSNAARSLARLRSDRALDALLAVFNGGDQALKQTVATTLAVNGSAQARQALRQMISVGKVSAGTVSKDALSMLDGK